MTIRLGIAALACCLGLEAARAQAKPEPINNWAELRTALRRCWQPPPGTEGALVTYRFALTKEGALRGPPRVTGRQLVGDEAAGRRYIESGERLLAICFPMAVTESFGRQFGMNVITLTLVNGPPRPARNLTNVMTIFARD